MIFAECCLSWVWTCEWTPSGWFFDHSVKVERILPPACPKKRIEIKIKSAKHVEDCTKKNVKSCTHTRCKQTNRHINWCTYKKLTMLKAESSQQMQYWRWYGMGWEGKGTRARLTDKLFRFQMVIFGKCGEGKEIKLAKNVHSRTPAQQLLKERFCLQLKKEKNRICGNKTANQGIANRRAARDNTQYSITMHIYIQYVCWQCVCNISRAR